MKFKKFFVKNVLLQFFAITTCVCVLIGVCGSLLEPEKTFGYDAFFSPLIFAALTSLTSLVEYSSKKQSPLEMKIRSILHIILIEAVVFLVIFVMEGYSDYMTAVALFFAVLIVYGAVTLIEYLSDRHTAEEINIALREMKERRGQ